MHTRTCTQNNTTSNSQYIGKTIFDTHRQRVLKTHSCELIVHGYTYYLHCSAELPHLDMTLSVVDSWFCVMWFPQQQQSTVTDCFKSFLEFHCEYGNGLEQKAYEQEWQTCVNGHGVTDPRLNFVNLQLDYQVTNFILAFYSQKYIVSWCSFQEDSNI